MNTSQRKGSGKERSSWTKTDMDEKDDYWNTSKAGNMGNFFDDDSTFEETEEGFAVLGISPNKAHSLSTAMKTQFDWKAEDFDTDSLINWDGSDTIKQSVRYTVPSLPNTQDLVAHDDHFAIHDDKDNVKDVVEAAVSKRPVNRAEITKLESEVQFLKRQLEMSKASRWKAPCVKDTVRSIILDKPYTLEVYKSKADKLALLDEAISAHDGNAISAAVLHLKNTVNRSIFQMELMMRPAAVSHYLKFMKEHFDIPEAIDLLVMLGRTEEAGMLMYKQSLNKKDPKFVGQSLQSCYNSHFTSEPSLSHDGQMLKEHIRLLGIQQPIEEADAVAEQSGQTPIFQKFPRPASVVNMSTMTTLYYSCFYHYDLKENSFASPDYIRKNFELTEKQFQWAAVSALSKLKYYTALEQLMTTKAMFGRTKLRASIGFDKVVDILQKSGAPVEVLEKYLRFVEDSNLKLSIAKKVKCHVVVVECLMTQRDRKQLESYAARLIPHTKESDYAHNALRNSSIKWKN